MRSKYFFITICTSILLSLTTIAQDWVKNPSFEEGEEAPEYNPSNITHCQFYHYYSLRWIDDWKKVVKLYQINPCIFGTTDWYSDDPNSTHYKYSLVNPHDGDFVVAMGSCEGVQQKLKTKIYKDEKVNISFWWRPLDANGGQYQIHLYLAKSKGNWKSNCSDIQKGIYNEVKQFDISVDAGGNHPIDNSWHLYSTGTFEADKNYDWIIITGENEPRDVVFGKYFEVDDVSIDKSCVLDCENGCSPTDGEISVLHNSFVTTAQSFRIWNLDNVTTATLEIFTQPCGLAGQALRSYTRTCASGVGEMEWDGRNMFGVHVADQVYCWALTVENDCGSCTFYGTVAKQGDYHQGLAPTICNPIIVPDPCCEYDIYIDNVTLSGTYEFVAVNNIYIATNGPVTVSDNANVLFQAGNEIIVGTFDYNEELGAEISKVIVPCPGNGKKDDDEGNDYVTETSEEEQEEEPQPNDINETSGISIHPNPTSGEFTIQVTGDAGQGTSEVFIYDLLGRLIYKSEIENLPAEALTQAGRKSKIVNISTHPKGIYMVKVLSGEKVYLKKLIHQ